MLPDPQATADTVKVTNNIFAVQKAEEEVQKDIEGIDESHDPVKMGRGAAIEDERYRMDEMTNQDHTVSEENPRNNSTTNSLKTCSAEGQTRREVFRNMHGISAPAKSPHNTINGVSNKQDSVLANIWQEDDSDQNELDIDELCKLVDREFHAIAHYYNTLEESDNDDMEKNRKPLPTNPGPQAAVNGLRNPSDGNDNVRNGLEDLPRLSDADSGNDQSVKSFDASNKVEVPIVSIRTGSDESNIELRDIMKEEELEDPDDEVVTDDSADDTSQSWEYDIGYDSEGERYVDLSDGTATMENAKQASLETVLGDLNAQVDTVLKAIVQDEDTLPEILPREQMEVLVNGEFGKAMDAYLMDKAKGEDLMEKVLDVLVLRE